MLKLAKIFTVVDIVLNVLVAIASIVLLIMGSLKGLFYLIAYALNIAILIGCLVSMGYEERSVGTGVMLSIFGFKIGAIIYWVWFAHANDDAKAAYYQDATGNKIPDVKVVEVVATKKECPHCHAMLTLTDNSCFNCGTDVSRIKPKKETKKQCPYCNTLVSINANECYFCKNKLAEIPSDAKLVKKQEYLEGKTGTKIKECPHCHNMVPTNEYFCPHCGADL